MIYLKDLANSMPGKPKRPRTAPSDSRPGKDEQADGNKPSGSHPSSDEGKPAFRPLELSRLAAGMPCLKPHSGATLAEASAVCLEERGHKQGAVLGVSGHVEASCVLSWPASDDQSRREWNDPDEATEKGAVGVAILLVSDMTEYHVVRRSIKTTGVDYYMSLKAETGFQESARLEVSGIRSGSKGMVTARVNQKIKQSKQSEGQGPVFVVVVEFNSPLAAVVMK